MNDELHKLLELIRQARDLTLKLNKEAGPVEHIVLMQLSDELCQSYRIADQLAYACEQVVLPCKSAITNAV